MATRKLTFRSWSSTAPSCGHRPSLGCVCSSREGAGGNTSRLNPTAHFLAWAFWAQPAVAMLPHRGWCRLRASTSSNLGTHTPPASSWESASAPSRLIRFTEPGVGTRRGAPRPGCFRSERLLCRTPHWVLFPPLLDYFLTSLRTMPAAYTRLDQDLFF